MKSIIAAVLIGAASVANGQDLSNLKLCSFDFDVSSSKIGFPDQVTEIYPGVNEWKYPNGRLHFQRRYLVRIVGDGIETRATPACEEKEIAAVSKDFAPPPAVRAVPPKDRPATRAKSKSGVQIGMTVKQVLNSSWGRPEDINRTTTRYGKREQWVYGGRNYLYFTDGILSAIQN